MDPTKSAQAKKQLRGQPNNRGQFKAESSVQAASAPAHSVDLQSPPAPPPLGMWERRAWEQATNGETQMFRETFSETKQLPGEDGYAYYRVPTVREFNSLDDMTRVMMGDVMATTVAEYRELADYRDNDAWGVEASLLDAVDSDGKDTVMAAGAEWVENFHIEDLAQGPEFAMQEMDGPKMEAGKVYATVDAQVRGDGVVGVRGVATRFDRYDSTTGRPLGALVHEFEGWFGHPQAICDILGSAPQR